MSAKRKATQPFLDLIADYKVVAGAAFAVGAVPPLLHFALSIGPPWPDREGIAYFTSIVNGVILLTAYVLWRHISLTKMRNRVRVFVSGSLGFLFVYIVLSASFVYNAPDAKHQVASGWELTQDVAELLAEARKQGIPITLEELLRGNEFNPETIWKPWTVRLIRISLLTTWLLMFGFVSCLIATAVVYMQKQAHNADRRDAKQQAAAPPP